MRDYTPRNLEGTGIASEALQIASEEGAERGRVTGESILISKELTARQSELQVRRINEIGKQDRVNELEGHASPLVLDAARVIIRGLHSFVERKRSKFDSRIKKREASIDEHREKLMTLGQIGLAKKERDRNYKIAQADLLMYDELPNLGDRGKQGLTEKIRTTIDNIITSVREKYNENSIIKKERRNGRDGLRMQKYETMADALNKYADMIDGTANNDTDAADGVNMEVSNVDVDEISQLEARITALNAQLAEHMTERVSSARTYHPSAESLAQDRNGEE